MHACRTVCYPKMNVYAEETAGLPSGDLVSTPASEYTQNINAGEWFGFYEKTIITLDISGFK